MSKMQKLFRCQINDLFNLKIIRFLAFFKRLQFFQRRRLSMELDVILGLIFLDIWIREQVFVTDIVDDQIDSFKIV